MLRCNLRIDLSAFRSLLLAFYVPPPVSSVPSTLLGQWIEHSTGIFQQYSEVIFDYFHPLSVIQTHFIYHG